jgi:hypothetical protein
MVTKTVQHVLKIVEFVFNCLLVVTEHVMVTKTVQHALKIAESALFVGMELVMEMRIVQHVQQIVVYVLGVKVPHNVVQIQPKHIVPELMFVEAQDSVIII